MPLSMQVTDVVAVEKSKVKKVIKKLKMKKKKKKVVTDGTLCDNDGQDQGDTAVEDHYINPKSGKPTCES